MKCCQDGVANMGHGNESLSSVHYKLCSQLDLVFWFLVLASFSRDEETYTHLASFNKLRYFFISSPLDLEVGITMKYS